MQKRSKRCFCVHQQEVFWKTDWINSFVLNFGLCFLICFTFAIYQTLRGSPKCSKPGTVHPWASSSGESWSKGRRGWSSEPPFCNLISVLGQCMIPLRGGCLSYCLLQWKAESSMFQRSLKRWIAIIFKIKQWLFRSERSFGKMRV